MRHTIMIAFETHYIVIGVSKFISAFHFLVTSIIGFLLLCERTLIDISFPFTITSIFTSKFPMDGWVRAPFHRLFVLFSSTQHVHCTHVSRLGDFPYLLLSKWIAFLCTLCEISFALIR